MSRLWSPVDLLSGTQAQSSSSRNSDSNLNRDSSSNRDPSSNREPNPNRESNPNRDSSRSRKSFPLDEDQVRKLMLPGGSSSRLLAPSGDFPPAAHSGNHTSISSSGRHHVITDTRGSFGKRGISDQQGILKKPRVRDYLGHRGSSTPSSSGLRHQELYLNPGRFPQAAPLELQQPPISLVKSKDHSCDKIPSLASPSKDDDGYAPLDLCIKKPESSRHSHHHASQSIVGGEESDSRRSSLDSSEGGIKRRGRKPKSLLASGTNATVTSNQHVHHQMLPLVPGSQQEVQRPKKRGRPPLLSPPPNIGLPNPVEEGLALMNRLFTQTLGHSTQLQPGWPTFSSTGQIIFPGGSKSNGSSSAVKEGRKEEGRKEEGRKEGPDLRLSLPSNSRLSVPGRPKKSTDSDSDDDVEDPSKADLRPGLNDEDIRQPLRLGWKRHTIIKKITTSGVRGEVLYFSPEGKRLRSHNDVSRYFTKYSPRNLRKDYFSFSNKWLVGEFIEPTADRKDHRIVSESEIMKRIEEMRRMKRKKMGLKATGKRGRPPRDGSEQDGMNNLGPEQRLNQDLLNLAAMNELNVLHMLQQAFAQTQSLEAEKKRREREEEEAAAAKKAKEAKERELKRQQMELQKEQEAQRRKELQMMAEIEKERRRQHMMLVRSLELFKRQEERDRKREEMLAEKRLQQEKKMQKKRIEMELMKELKKPVDDMMLKDLKPLPVLNRIPGLKLPSTVFAQLLMVYEFLNNFGSTLGFDMDTLPTMNTFQSALLNDDESAEDELLSVLNHLLVCAIEDPGPPVNMTTITGQKLKDVPVTNVNVSEILKTYLQSFIHHRESAKDGVEGRLVTALSQGKPFLSLSAELKAQSLSFLCNELLCSQSIVKQIEENIESIANLRREKWLIDCDLRKFRGIKMKRELREKMEQTKDEVTNPDSANPDGANPDGAIVDGVKNGVAENEIGNNGKYQVLKVVDEDSDDSGDESGIVNPITMPFIPPPIGALSSYGGVSYSIAMTDEEPGMTNEDVDKKLDKLNRQATLFTNKLNRAIHGLRVAPLGQDRYRRRYWLLPATGGVFVEGLESGEPEAAEENPWSLDDEEEEEEVQQDAEEKMVVTQELEAKDEEKDGAKDGAKDEEEKPLVNGDAKPKEETEEEENEKTVDTVAPTEVNGEVKDGEVEGPVVNGESPEKSVTNGTGSAPFVPVGVESQLPIKSSKPWFSLFPRIPCCETIVDPPKPSVNGENGEQESEEMDVMEGIEGFKSSSLPFLTDLSSIASSIEDLGEICPALQRQIAKQKEEQYETPRKIPGKYQLGWWRITDPSQLRSLNEALHERGVRERNLSKHILKHMNGIAQKCKCDAVQLEITDLDRLICEGCPFGVPQPSETDFDPEVALRVDLAVLQHIEDLEERIASSSMQVRGWKQSPRLASDSSLTFEYKLASELAERDAREAKEGEKEEEEEEEEAMEDDVLNPVICGRERLLTTEAAIERRYLKPPLGFKSNTILLPTGAVDELAENAADENATSGLLRWREAVRECVTASQLSLLLHFLESCIAWDKSIMRASCQFCTGGENEEQLLLCDGCDKGYHMYCFRPKMETIPDGDWFCFECQNKNTIDKICVLCGKKGKLLSCDTCPKVYHPNCHDPPVSKPPKGKWSCHMCKKTPKKVTGRKTATSAAAAAASASIDSNTPSGKGSKESPLKESAPGHSSNTPKESSKKGSSKKGAKEKTSKSAVTLKGGSTPKAGVTPKGGSTPKEVKEKETNSSSIEDPLSKKSKRSKENKESLALTACQVLLGEMEKHDDSWPFQKPVNTKQFPTYKKIIKQPIDLASMKAKFENGTYKTKSDFQSDVILMFNNCETFNEDESPVGRCGHKLKAFFDTRWKELVEGKK